LPRRPGPDRLGVFLLDGARRRGSASRVPSEADPPRTRRFAKYDLVARVSTHHGISTFRAVQTAIGRTVLVTILPPDAGRIAAQRERFHRHQQVASRLHHENVISTIDAGTHKGCRYFVTEFVEGHPLSAEIEEKGRFEIARAVVVARDVARALAFLDAEGIVHRNVSPSNVLVTDAGVVKLVGFALAKERRPGTPGAETWIDHDSGAALYMAPEWLRGERGLDARADIYSLGCVLYDLLTGLPPFHARSNAVILEAHAKFPPTDPRELRDDLPPPLVEVLDRCLRKKREHRYAKPDDLARDLEAVRTGQAVSKMSADGVLWPAPATGLLPRIRKR
jgi:serine/threonine protein kinase